MTALVKEYLNFKNTEFRQAWGASDELYDKLMAKDDAYLKRMNNAELKYLIDHTTGKEQYSYKLLLEKRKNTRTKTSVETVAAAAM